MNSNKIIVLLLAISLLFIFSCSEDEPTAPLNEIMVVSPNGGESWLGGTSNAITWTNNISENVKIELYKGGNVLYTIVSSTSNGGNYSWTIPDTLQSGIDYKVKISSLLDSNINDFSDEDFTIVKQVFTNEYTGFLELRFTNTFPSFDEITQVDVHIDKYGQVTFGTGTLSYNADDNNGQSRIVRNGTLQINPNGYYFDNSGEDYVHVNENTTINENMIVYVWDSNSLSWIEYANENINTVWNGGLAFSIDDAVLTGSIISSANEWGSVTWGLYLVVVP